LETGRFAREGRRRWELTGGNSTSHNLSTGNKDNRNNVPVIVFVVGASPAVGFCNVGTSSGWDRYSLTTTLLALLLSWEGVILVVIFVFSSGGVMAESESARRWSKKQHIAHHVSGRKDKLEGNKKGSQSVS
jgi:hypothetical protein